jgi:hypothetical protein
MRAQLDIVWDGTAPGLAEHELSISALNKSLHLLLVAVRRIRTNTAVGATGDSERGGRGGRLARGCDQIDLRVRALGEGCLSLGIDVLFPDSPTGNMFEAMHVEETMAALVDALAAESRGEPRNLAVRKYLRSLEGVTSQRYTARVGNKVVRSEALGTLALPPDTSDHPYPREIVGEIGGVLFPPSEPEVVLTPLEGAKVRLAASADQVERALALRGMPIIARVMNRGRDRPRLLSLRAAGAGQKLRIDVEAAGAFVLERWRDTLERLGR